VPAFFLAVGTFGGYLGRVRVTAWTRGVVATALALLASAAEAHAMPATMPMNVHVTATTATSFSLAWDPPTEAGVVGAHIVADSASSPYRIDLKSADAATLTSGDIGGLTCGTGYDLAVNWSDGTSLGPQTTIRGTTSDCTKPTAPAPSGLTGSALNAGSIRFSWEDSAGPVAGDVAYALTGPLYPIARRLVRTSHRTSIDLGRLVCGETYTFKVGWVNDEGALSPTSSVDARTSDCSTLGPARPGPAMVKITRADLLGYTVEFDPKRDDAIGYRLSATGPSVNASSYESTFFVAGDTFRAINFSATCGETYTVAVQWVFDDGGVSQPTSASAPAPACPVSFDPAGTPSPAQQRDTMPPKVTIAKRRLQLNKKGAIMLTLACKTGEGHCSGTVTLRDSKQRTCGKATFHIAGGAARTLAIKLRRRALAALKKSRSAPFSLAIAARDDSAKRSTRTVALRILAKRPA
jgi:hypothetical protein